jgi:hypothetical protein
MSTAPAGGAVAGAGGENGNGAASTVGPALDLESGYASLHAILVGGPA